MPLITAGISGAVGLAKSITGAINNKKAKKEARELEANRPKYQISDLAKKDLSLAESEVGAGGLSATAENAYNNLNNKQFSASLGAILRGGGSVNNVADVFSANDEGRQRLALLSDQMRLNKIDRLSQSRKQMMEQEDKAFMYNVDAPWKDKAQAASQSRQQAQKDIWGGIDTAAGAAMGFFGNQYNQKQYDNYFNQGQQGGGQGNSVDNSTYNIPGRMQAQLPTSSPGSQFTPYQPQARLTYPPDNSVYSYNWTPNDEKNQFQNDFGLIYQ